MAKRQTSLELEQIRLHDRITRFYDALNCKNWEVCFNLLDPKLRQKRVDYERYAESLSSFLDKYGPIKIESIENLTLHLHEKNRLYDDRPFAFGVVRWQDNRRQHQVFRVRWVKSHGTWYTRVIGLV